MDLLPFIIAGLTTGSVYGLAGVGLVLTYKTSGVFNFAYGSLATVAAFVFYTLSDEHGVAWPLAAVIAVVVAGPVAGLLLEMLGRVLVRSGVVSQVAGTLGLVLIVEAGVNLIFGTTQTRVDSVYLPHHTFDLDGTAVAASDVIVIAVALALTVGLCFYFRRARGGVAMRGVVDDADLLALGGTNPTSVRRLAWVISVTFAALCGVLIAPLLAQIDATTLTLLVVTAFGAAAIGMFGNIPLTYAGGLIIGLGSSLSTKYFTSGAWANLSSALPFIVLFAAQVLSRRGSLAAQPGPRGRVLSVARAPVRLRIGGGIALLAFLLTVPSFAGYHIDDWTSFGANVILFLSLGLLVRTSGQVSLCHGALLAIGVATFSHLAVDHHVPWLVALLLAGLIAVPIGAALSIPAIRLSGLYLALATLGFGIAVAYVFYSTNFMFGSLGLGLTVPRPDLSWVDLSSNEGYYFLTLGLATLTTLVVLVLNRSRLGRLLSALSSSPIGLSTSGTSIVVTRVLVFCFSAFLAAIAGALGGAVGGVVTGDQYAPLLSLTYLVLVVIAWGGDPWYAVLSAAGLSLVPSYLTGANVTQYLTLVFGIAAVLYVATPSLRGLPPSVLRLLERIPLVSPKEPAQDEVPRAAEVFSEARGVLKGASQTHHRAGDSGLEVRGLHVRFGGTIALDDVSFGAPCGRITGLIGPNGAGKTTLLNVCSGLIPSSGQVVLEGTDVSGRGPSVRARLGLGRTFQRMELFDNLTVQENVQWGREASFAGYNPLGQLVSTKSQRSETTLATQEAIELCGIRGIAPRPVASLSTGERRLVELARCLAGPFSVLLLDEPSSGLDRFETERFGEILRTVVADRGVGILLVEHDIALVTSICHEVHVLEFGRMIFTGTPSEVSASSLVRAAYLGSESVAVDDVRSLEVPT